MSSADRTAEKITLWCDVSNQLLKTKTPLARLFGENMQSVRTYNLYVISRTILRFTKTKENSDFTQHTAHNSLFKLLAEHGLFLGKTSETWPIILKIGLTSIAVVHLKIVKPVYPPDSSNSRPCQCFLCSKIQRRRSSLWRVAVKHLQNTRFNVHSWLYIPLRRPQLLITFDRIERNVTPRHLKNNTTTTLPSFPEWAEK